MKAQIQEGIQILLQDIEEEHGELMDVMNVIDLLMKVEPLPTDNVKELSAEYYTALNLIRGKMKTVLDSMDTDISMIRSKIKELEQVQEG